MTWRIGVDIGGTFTDVAVVDDTSGRIGAAKTLTTPRDFVAGVLEALGSPNPAFFDAVQRSAATARVRGTPTVLVDGKPLEGSSIQDLADRLEKLAAG